jgi:hypothetical protein
MGNLVVPCIKPEMSGNEGDTTMETALEGTRPIPQENNTDNNNASVPVQQDEVIFMNDVLILPPNVNSLFNMAPKRLLSKLTTDRQEYYIFLAKECFAGFSNAEYNFNVYRDASCYAWLVHSSEFFWKSLTILSGNYFELRHEASQADMAKISKALLSNDERIKAYDILSQFPEIKRDLASYGYYEKGTHVTASPNAAFNRENTEVLG